jgi:hypothetical protein
MENWAIEKDECNKRKIHVGREKKITIGSAKGEKTSKIIDLGQKPQPART